MVHPEAFLTYHIGRFGDQWLTMFEDAVVGVSTSQWHAEAIGESLLIMSRVELDQLNEVVEKHARMYRAFGPRRG